MICLKAPRQLTIWIVSTRPLESINRYLSVKFAAAYSLQCTIWDNQPNVSIYQGQHSLEIIIFCHVDSMLTRLIIDLSSIKSRFYNFDHIKYYVNVDNMSSSLYNYRRRHSFDANLQRLIHQHHESLPKGKITPHTNLHQKLPQFFVIQ